MSGRSGFFPGVARRKGNVVTALRLGDGVSFGATVPGFLLGTRTDGPAPTPAPRIAPDGGATMESAGGLAAGVGASFAAGAGVGAGVFGVEDTLS